ncbi:hypothetical protein L6258_02920 [Candidatus Parcubacteria bacterium]|nr:hypothetical protein [Candidatus Parcubacteria bacterium]
MPARKSVRPKKFRHTKKPQGGRGFFRGLLGELGRVFFFKKARLVEQFPHLLFSTFLVILIVFTVQLVQTPVSLLSQAGAGQCRVGDYRADPECPPRVVGEGGCREAAATLFDRVPQARLDAAGEVAVSWSYAGHEKVSGYRVYRGESEDRMHYLTTVCYPPEQLTDHWAACGKEYFYKVVAVTACAVQCEVCQTSLVSNSVVTPPCPSGIPSDEPEPGCPPQGCYDGVAPEGIIPESAAVRPGETIEFTGGNSSALEYTWQSFRYGESIEESSFTALWGGWQGLPNRFTPTNRLLSETFTPRSSAQIDKVDVYLQVAGAGVVTAGIYDSDGVLITREEYKVYRMFTGFEGEGWFTFDFFTEPVLQAGEPHTIVLKKNVEGGDISWRRAEDSNFYKLWSRLGGGNQGEFSSNTYQTTWTAPEDAVVGDIFAITARALDECGWGWCPAVYVFIDPGPCRNCPTPYAAGCHAITSDRSLVGLGIGDRVEFTVYGWVAADDPVDHTIDKVRFTLKQNGEYTGAEVSWSEAAAEEVLVSDGSCPLEGRCFKGSLKVPLSSAGEGFSVEGQVHSTRLGWQEYSQ